MTSSPSSPAIVPRNGIQRNNSTPAVHTIASSRATGRVSMDSYDRAKYLRPSPADVLSSAPAKTQTPKKSRHKKSSSSPSSLQSPPLVPASPASSSSSVYTPATPSLTSFLASIPGIVVESEVEPLDLTQSELPRRSIEEATVTSVSSLFFGRSHGSASNTPAATPPASPSLRAAPTNLSVNPSPSTTPPSSPSPSFLATWHGRLPSIPRPSPMMPFRAAKKVVTSVTSVGTGFLPSKEQLGSIPVAGRILKHPVMDSTLTYIASKTTRRRGIESKVIPPEDAHYFKLNEKLVDQAMTLSALAIEKEEQSKTVDDEASDDAFELYLAAIATLVHALPIETCDPLRREALEAQLRGFLKENELDTTDGEEVDYKQLRRRRRRRHREHREQASSLIYQFSSAPAADNCPAGSNDSPQNTHQPQHSRQLHGKPGQCERRGRKQRNRKAKAGPSVSETIISTAVESAIRLKQSPIPDVIKTCFHATRLILSKVDERFQLQERVWQLSKQSLEKAIELDEQYSIHQFITETFFAAITGLVKAGIAYKETPGYASVKQLTDQQQNQGLIEGAPVASEEQQSLSPQVILDNKKASSSFWNRRRYSIIEEVDEENVVEDEEVGYKRRDSVESSSSSSSDAISVEERGYDSDDDYESGSNRGSFEMKRPNFFSASMTEKIGVVTTIRSVASLIVGSLLVK
ncbi:hypothetical protein EDD21DRAFT_86142 [Dissophora ornata]|nr:hypothetical protein BGZ58_001705 [Dissophora ornata]KAI8602148.1 hypothetical protein EDD21DRAFT_86142 [Dissophora ornata]